MNVTMRNPFYGVSERTLDQAVQEKMKVLKEFYVVDKNNAREIEAQLCAACKAEPNKNFDIVLDRVAHTLIQRKLGEF